MGKKRSQRKDVSDSSDDDSSSSTSTALSELTLSKEPERVDSLEYKLEKYLDALFEKRGSVREAALLGLVSAFEGHLLVTFVENKCVTLLHQYINSIKKGSTKEACLASRAIGLLAITVGAGSSAHEIMEESLPLLSQALKSGSDLVKKSSVLDCLSIITFVGADNIDETVRSMNIMWEMIHPKAGTNVGIVHKPTSAVLAVAISAWTFLLTTIDGWSSNIENLKESISFLSTLLAKDDRSVRIAAGEAIAVISETGMLDNANNESLKGRILPKVRGLSTEAGGKGIGKKDLGNQRDLFQDILKYFETGDCPETSTKISNKHGVMKTSTWSQLIQLNFLKRLLGSGFLKHMQDNELLHDIFDFTPIKGKLIGKEKRMFLSPNSKLNKGRSQMRNEDRKSVQSMKQGQFVACS